MLNFPEIITQSKFNKKEKINIFDTMDNFFNDEELSFMSLKKLIREKFAERSKKYINTLEYRIESELSLINKMGIAPLIMFYYGIVNELKDTSYVHIAGSINMLYICHILGITSVNAAVINARCECVMSGPVRWLPTCKMIVSKGIKGRIINYINNKYGENKIARASDDNYYVVANKDISDYFEIASTVNYKELNDNFTWHEQVLKDRKTKLAKENFVTFEIVENDCMPMLNYEKVWEFIRENQYMVSNLCYYVSNKNRQHKSMRYTNRSDIEIEDIFKDTKGRFFYYDTQFYDFCNKILNLNDENTAELNHFILVGNMSVIIDFSYELENKFGKKGNEIARFIEYNLPLTESKAYVSSKIMFCAIINHFKELAKESQMDKQNASGRMELSYEEQNGKIREYPYNLIDEMLESKILVENDHKRTDKLVKKLMKKILNDVQQFVLIRVYQDGQNLTDIAKEMEMDSEIVAEIFYDGIEELKKPLFKDELIKLIKEEFYGYKEKAWKELIGIDN